MDQSLFAILFDQLLPMSGCKVVTLVAVTVQVGRVISKYASEKVYTCCLLLLSIPFLSTRIVPLHFQVGGCRKRQNLGLVCCVYFVLSVFLS